MFKSGQKVMVLVRENLSVNMVPYEATIIEAYVPNPTFGAVDHRFHRVRINDNHIFNAHERFLIPYLDYNDILKDIL